MHASAQEYRPHIRTLTQAKCHGTLVESRKSPRLRFYYCPFASAGGPAPPQASRRLRHPSGLAQKSNSHDCAWHFQVEILPNCTLEFSAINELTVPSTRRVRACAAHAGTTLALQTAIHKFKTEKARRAPSSSEETENLPLGTRVGSLAEVSWHTGPLGSPADWPQHCANNDSRRRG